MKIGNVSQSKMTYNLLKKALDAAEVRKKVLANNIANINTKGYKRHYVNFEDSLNEMKNELQLDVTSEKHITHNNKKFGEIEVKRDESKSMRMDGNNVDIDNESANLAANTLKYNALIKQFNSRLSIKRYIITGGR